MRGHLKNDPKEKEQSGSSAYVPREPEKDTQLQYALAMLRDGTEAPPSTALSTTKPAPATVAPGASIPTPPAEKKAE